MLASQALTQVGQMLDDEGFVHADAGTALRLLNRAHQLIALRYLLVRETREITLQASTPLYHLPTVFPGFVRFDSADCEGTAVWPVSKRVIQLGDPQWLATEADRPEWIYAEGILWFGVYPRPTTELVLSMTAIVVPDDLLTTGQSLVLPDAYLPRVIELTAGMLMIGSERAVKQGLLHITNGLGLDTLKEVA